MNKKNYFLIVLSFLLPIGFSVLANAQEDSNGSAESLLSPIQTNQLGDKVLGDKPAALNFKQLETLFAHGKKEGLALGVYEFALTPLDPNTYPQQRAKQLGFQDQEIPLANELGKEEHFYFKDKTRELHFYGSTEFLVDTKAFHQGEGVSSNRLLPEQHYIQKAWSYLGQNISSLSTSETLYPYKVRYYKNAIAQVGKTERVTTYQVAVAFNMAVEGLPVIGPGAKVVIHMTPQGKVISHENSIRPIGQRIATISGTTLLSPDEARTQVEQNLKSRGIDPSSYDIVRAEFGYLHRGRLSKQDLIAPHYAFFYQPKSPSSFESKRIVEVIPATIDNYILSLLSINQPTATPSDIPFELNVK